MPYEAAPPLPSAPGELPIKFAAQNDDLRLFPYSYIQGRPLHLNPSSGIGHYVPLFDIDDLLSPFPRPPPNIRPPGPRMGPC